VKREIIYGIRPVLEALQSGRREVHEVLLSDDHDEIAEATAGRGVQVKRAPKDELAELVSGGVHQGVVARVGSYPYCVAEELLTDPEPLVLVLDGVTDPHNLGAALRVADGAGASGVVIPKDRAAEVTPAAVKASVGASEHVAVARETNLRRAIDRMKGAGGWVYAATEAGKFYAGENLEGPLALVIGSEGRGVRRLVREGCDGEISIPMFGAVSSLNVSVAAAVLLYEARRQRGWSSI
jgi:23S rRNA (guanosine2251-2'-O)-methyltransferase